MPSRWNHVCGAIEYKKDNNAKRTIYADGKENFVFTSKYLDEVKWKLGHNFTFGGRKFVQSGFHLKGLITDVQIFSRKLSADEMIAYTNCTKVTGI